MSLVSVSHVFCYPAGAVSFFSCLSVSSTFVPRSLWQRFLVPACDFAVVVAGGSWLRRRCRWVWRRLVGSRYTQGPASIHADVLKIHLPYKPCTIGHSAHPHPPPRAASTGLQPLQPPHAAPSQATHMTLPQLLCDHGLASSGHSE
jgi:hypothetical protein